MFVPKEEDNLSPTITVNAEEIIKGSIFPYRHLFNEPDALFDLELSYFNNQYAFTNCFIKCYFDDFLDEEVFCKIDNDYFILTSEIKSILISLEEKIAYIMEPVSKKGNYMEVIIDEKKICPIKDIWTKFTIFYIWLFFEINAQAFKSYNRYEKCKRYMKRMHEKAEPLPPKTIRLQKSIEVFFDDNQTDTLREYKRRCESWQVRGHYRHYKNGKTVFIEPYTKGQGKIKQTNYVIGGAEQ
jgi:hypothetical protein